MYTHWRLSVGNFECEKQTDFSIDSTTKTKVQIKLKRKSQETSASGGKINLQRKNCRKVKTYGYFLLIWRNLMTKQARKKIQKTLYLI